MGFDDLCRDIARSKSRAVCMDCVVPCLPCERSDREDVYFKKCK